MIKVDIQSVIAKYLTAVPISHSLYIMHRFWKGAESSVIKVSPYPTLALSFGLMAWNPILRWDKKNKLCLLFYF